MAGDTLARGAKSATFGPPKVSQERWDAIWEKSAEEKMLEILEPHLTPENMEKLENYGKQLQRKPAENNERISKL